MSLPSPSIADRTKNWFKLGKRRPRYPPTQEDRGTGSFSNAHDFTVNGGQLIDVNEMKINYFNTVILNRGAVFELLEPYTCLDATKDSSARHPPPRCHPETRLKIRSRLRRWLVDEYDEWKMLWVRGSAGTGKSAVAQSFGDSCEEEEILGGSYFFSRTTGRDKLETVVPTLVYQLARSVPEYRSLIECRLAEDRILLRNSPPVQFRKLIIEPFATLQRQHPCKRFVMILDGLDECQGENAQREILEMIINSIRTNPDLPLRWLIFSRPEAHLKNAFSRNTECGREELIIDAECRENVEQYVTDRLTAVKAKYNDIIPADWPPQDKLQELLDAVAGLFIFASTSLNYVDDPAAADPCSQLDFLLTFIRRSQEAVSINPLASLDLLYSRVFEHIPLPVLNITRRILSYMTYREKIGRRLDSTQVLCNFLRLDQHTFYKAVRGLHSVMYIPEPEDASKLRLRFHHASFLEFLLDPHRSGKLVIREQEALGNVIYSGSFWCDVDMMQSQARAHDEHKRDQNHKHDGLPGLTWASEDNQLSLSQSITTFVGFDLLNGDLEMKLDTVDEDLLSQISNFDFRYWDAWKVLILAQLCGLDSSTSVLRVEPSSPTDHQLLEYFNLVIENGIAKPAVLPLRRHIPDDQWVREYFFIGHGLKSVIIWRTGLPRSAIEVCSLRCDQEPSETQVSMYQQSLRNIEWNEEKAKSEMK